MCQGDQREELGTSLVAGAHGHRHARMHWHIGGHSVACLARSMVCFSSHASPSSHSSPKAMKAPRRPLVAALALAIVPRCSAVTPVQKVLEMLQGMLVKAKESKEAVVSSRGSPPMAVSMRWVGSVGIGRGSGTRAERSALEAHP